MDEVRDPNQHVHVGPWNGSSAQGSRISRKPEPALCRIDDPDGPDWLQTMSRAVSHYDGVVLEGNWRTVYTIPEYRARNRAEQNIKDELLERISQRAIKVLGSKTKPGSKIITLFDDADIGMIVLTGIGTIVNIDTQEGVGVGSNYIAPPDCEACKTPTLATLYTQAQTRTGSQEAFRRKYIAPVEAHFRAWGVPEQYL